MPDPTKPVFLSYASQDADAARRICDALRSAGLEVWFDQSELRGGDTWDASIRRQIKECGLFVPLISAHTQAREEGYFRREWNLAVARTLDMAHDKAFLLPIVVDDTAEPGARVPEKFHEVQWTRLPGGEAPRAFVERVLRLVSGSAMAAATGAPSSAQQSAPPRAAPAATTGPAASPGAGKPPPSIAVMPFVNMSRDEENEYFADGLAEELLNVITKIRGLRVAARTSSFSFKGKDADIQTIAAKLNVATILEGSVRRAGKRVRVTAQLINAADGYHLWSETYDRELDDIFAVQDDIAQAVVKELQANLMAPTAESAGEQVKSATLGRTVEAGALSLRLQGRHLFRLGNRQGYGGAIDCYRRALAIDGNYAGAWADLALALFWHTATGGAHQAADDYMKGFAEARDAADRALAREPDLAEAHLARAFILDSMTWDRKESQREFRRALELAPGDADVARFVALTETVRGNFDEALRLALRSIDLDPLNTAGYGALGRVYLYTDRLAEAEAAHRKILEMNPQSTMARGWICWVQLTQGRIDEAAAMAESINEADWRDLLRVYVLWSQGRREESTRLLAEITPKYANFYAYQFAEIHAHRGEPDPAFEWLERAFAQHDPGLHHAYADPILVPLRKDPRWPALMKKIGYGD